MNIEQLIWAGFDVQTERIYKSKTDPFALPIRETVPPEVVALRTMAPTEEDEKKGDPYYTRKRLAAQYSNAGMIVDNAIDVWGWNIENTYASRRDNGERAIDDALMHNLIFTPPEVIPPALKE